MEGEGSLGSEMVGVAIAKDPFIAVADLPTSCNNNIMIVIHGLVILK